LRVYCDIDGVINAWHADRAWGLGMESEDVSEYILAWSSRMVHVLGSLLEEDGVELVWLSGWRTDALLVSKAIGWEGAGRVLGPVSGVLSFPSVYWKAEALWEDLAGYQGYWAWFDTGVGAIAMEREYSELIGADRGYVPAIVAEVGITPEILISLELRMDVENEWKGGV
jgi:hypothetical protein